MNEGREVTTQQKDTRGSVGLLGRTKRDERATKTWHTLMHVTPVR